MTSRHQQSTSRIPVGPRHVWQLRPVERVRRGTALETSSHVASVAKLELRLATWLLADEPLMTFLVPPVGARTRRRLRMLAPTPPALDAIRSDLVRDEPEAVLVRERLDRAYVGRDADATPFRRLEVKAVPVGGVVVP